MTEVKIKTFQTRVVDHPRDGSRILQVIGFESRHPTLSEMKIALDLAKEQGLKHASFPGSGMIGHECDSCGVPVVDEEPRESLRCSWCRDVMMLATIQRAEPRMLVNGKPVVFGMTATEITLRAQLCERIGVIMLSMAEDFRRLEPTETDTAFVLEAQLYTDACSTGVACRLRTGHEGACQHACQACAGKGYTLGVERMEHFERGSTDVSINVSCEVCAGHGIVRVCGRCRGRLRDPYDQAVDCQACEGAGFFTLIEVQSDGN